MCIRDSYSRFAVEQGYIPIAPHLLFPQFLNDADPKERQLGLFFGNALMSKCSEVWVFGSRISAGMESEIERAKWQHYHLRYFTCLLYTSTTRSSTKKCPGHDKKRSAAASTHLLCGHGGAFAVAAAAMQMNRVPAANGWSPE